MASHSGPGARETVDEAQLALAAARLRELHAELLRDPSATRTLERWCAAHGALPDARLVALRAPSGAVAPPPRARVWLDVDTAEELRHRRVRLACGGRILVEADNWYVPARLSPAMNRTLETTDIPFGRVVESLGFSRERLVAEVLWPGPSSDGARGVRGGALPDRVLHHRAVLRDAGGLPFCLVDERYTAAVLAGVLPAEAG